MARVCLVIEAFRRDGHHAIKDPDLLWSGAALAKATTDFELERLLQTTLGPIDVRIQSKSGEIITMEHNHKGILGMMENYMGSLHPL